MSFPGFMVVPVTIVHPTASTDRFGNATRDWTTAASISTTGWFAQQRSAEPVGVGRPASVTTNDVLFLEPHEMIDAGDRVLIDGTTYEVDGRPLAARTPRGVHHLEVALRSAVG